MNIEYEAKFYIEKDKARKLLRKAGAKLIRKEFFQKRIVFDLPTSTKEKRSFLRVRDEGDKITLTLKVFSGTQIENQQELEVTVNDFNTMVSILKNMGLTPATHEESRRESWSLDNTDITIDTWPHLGTIIEIEGKSEARVRKVSEKLGFDWKEAQFCPVGNLYIKKYGLGPADLAKKTGKMTNLLFKGKNPFLK